jgi:hypothetical protein
MSLRALVARPTARFREQRGISRGKCVVLGVPHRTLLECGRMAANDDTSGQREQAAWRIFLNPAFVMPGHSRPKDGVGSLAHGAGHPRLGPACTFCLLPRRGCPRASAGMTGLGRAKLEDALATGEARFCDLNHRTIWRPSVHLARRAEFL